MGISLKDVSFRYNQDDFLLSGINIDIPAGLFLGITGPNGSGKSTLSYLINGLIPHYFKGIFKGDVMIDGDNTRGKKISDLSKKVAMVFQNPDFSLFNLTVYEELEFGLKNLRFTDYREKISLALKMVGLEGYEKKDPQRLSLGEKQKVCLASSIALDTPYIILDEPVSQLDYQSGVNIYEILTRLNKQGKTVITIEHDTDYLYKYTRKSLVLNKGKIALFGENRAVFSDTACLKKLGIRIPKL